MCRQETPWSWGAGANLCSGASPHTWRRIMMEGSSKLNGWYIFIIHDVQFISLTIPVWLRRIVQQERYGVLTLVNTTGADTGEYTCYPLYCEGTDCRKEYDKAVKVFVFFPGEVKQLYGCLHVHFSEPPPPYFTCQLDRKPHLSYHQSAVSSH